MRSPAVENTGLLVDMADHELPEHYNPEANKEVVGENYHFHPAGLEVAPNQAKPTFAFDYSERVREDTPPRTILGLRRATFFLSLALIVVILAAGIGAGVGGSVAVNNARNSCATNSTMPSSPISALTTTATVTIEAGTTSTTAGRLVVPTGVVALDCPSLSGTSETIKLGSKSWVFDLTCGTDFGGGDIGAVIVYSINDCMQACAAHNYFSNDNSCQHVTFNANQTSEIPKDYGNCWLKTGEVEGQEGDSNLICGAAISSFPQ